MFEILFAPSDERVVDRQFPSSTEAEEMAEQLRIFHGNGVKIKIRKLVEDPNWREREEKRFADGSYRPLPRFWTESGWWKKNANNIVDLYAHRHPSNPAFVSLTPSVAHGSQNRKLALDGPAFLARYFGQRSAHPVLTSDRVALLGQGLQMEDFQLEISKKPEDFERIYAGHHIRSQSSAHVSCMSYAKNHFKTEFHPTYAYGAGDLAMAWIERDGKILSRAVIWPEEKTWVRIYSLDETYRMIMQNHLQEGGYRAAKHFEGARLLKLPISNRPDHYLCPYVDGDINQIADGGKFLVISAKGEMPGRVQNGITQSNFRACESCGVRGDASHYHSIYLPPTNAEENRRHARNGHPLVSWCRVCSREQTVHDAITGGTFSKKTGDWVSVCMNSADDGDRYKTLRFNLDSNTFLCQKTQKYYATGNFRSVNVIVDEKRTEEIWCRQATLTLFVRIPSGNYVKGHPAIEEYFRSIPEAKRAKEIPESMHEILKKNYNRLTRKDLTELESMLHIEL